MKIKELKHNHTLTDLLKVILFSIVMLLPFFSVLTKSLYVICNKNAKDSYYGETINQKQYISIDYENLIEGNTYIFNNTITTDRTDNYGNNNILYVADVVNLNGFNNNIDLSSVTNIRLYLTSNYNALNFRDASFNQITSFNEFDTQAMFSFRYMGLSGDKEVLSYYNFFEKIEYNEYSYLDNAFEYSIYQLENSNLYNWTKTTGTYTGINAMCNGIGINMNVIPMILTYWFLMSVIYIVLDIVIRVITYLTHMIGSKSA